MPCLHTAGSLDVRCLERRAGGLQQPTRLRPHTDTVTACDADFSSGLVVTAAKDGSVALWRSAAAMAAQGAGALVGRCQHATSVRQAWILQPQHLGAPISA